MRTVDLAIQIHVANPWSTKDWADMFLPPLAEACNRVSTKPIREANERRPAVLLISQSAGPGDATGVELCSLAYHMQQSHEMLDVRYCFVTQRNPSLSWMMQRMDVEGIHNVLFVAWRMNSDDVGQLFAEIGSLHAVELQIGSIGIGPVGFAWTWNRASRNQPEPIEILGHAGWLHVIMGRYLDALATRSVERYFETHPAKANSVDRSIVHGLIELDRRVDAMLPPEYQGRMDDVRPQSMGSAPIPSDGFGQVPWDEIWTSFCDLAMAGGPPHRGRLLEAVPQEDVRKDLVAYEHVVQEIRRGIEMVTGLKTEPSETLGWVGILCDDEGMCTWLMRAILVENVMVRREGRVLYLPAGPEFRVKKEIKNVITCVAKTVHYWRAHLKFV